MNMNSAPTLAESQRGKASKTSRLSIAMLDYLCRPGTLKPSIDDYPNSGCPRKYSFGDLVVLHVIARMLDAGGSVARVRGALKKLAQIQGSITESTVPSRYLVTNGEDIFFKNT